METGYASSNDKTYWRCYYSSQYSGIHENGYHTRIFGVK